MNCTAVTKCFEAKKNSFSSAHLPLIYHEYILPSVLNSEKEVMNLVN